MCMCVSVMERAKQCFFCTAQDGLSELSTHLIAYTVILGGGWI